MQSYILTWLKKTDPLIALGSHHGGYFISASGVPHYSFDTMNTHLASRLVNAHTAYKTLAVHYVV